jgi:Zn-dependent M28 family amino/carboxypeptidase
MNGNANNNANDGTNDVNSVATSGNATSGQESKSINFDADSAYHSIAVQLAFGARVPGSSAHRLCGDYIVATLHSYNAEVFEQQFNAVLWSGKTVQGRNIIASFNPEQKQRVIIAAHWDSRATADHDPDVNNHNSPVPAANDGASGVAVMLEIARQFSINKPVIGVDIIFFDIEDQGAPQNSDKQDNFHWCKGAQYWAAYPHKQSYKAKYGILLDMVGCQKPCFSLEGVTKFYAKDVYQQIVNTAIQLGYGYAFSTEETGDILDDHYFVNAYMHIPMADIIQHDRNTPTHFFPQWHTINDDIDHVDKNTLKMVGDVVLKMIY